MPGRPKKQIQTAAELETAIEQLSELALARAPGWIREKYEDPHFELDDGADERVAAWCGLLQSFQQTLWAAQELHDVYRLGTRSEANDGEAIISKLAEG